MWELPYAWPRRPILARNVVMIAGGGNPVDAIVATPITLTLVRQVSVESGFPPATLYGLRERGHELVTVDDYNLCIRSLAL